MGGRGNHCTDDLFFNQGWSFSKAECEEKCDNFANCGGYEWGRQSLYSCALYFHNTADPPTLSAGWSCNFTTIHKYHKHTYTLFNHAGSIPVSRSHDYGHKGNCFVKDVQR